MSTAANLPTRQFPWTSPVDATVLADTGLTGELTLQLHTGWSAADALVSKRQTSQPGQAGTAGEPVTNDSVDEATLGQLHGQGYDQIVLLSADVTSTPPASSGGSTADPFTIASPQGTASTGAAAVLLALWVRTTVQRRTEQAGGTAAP